MKSCGGREGKETVWFVWLFRFMSAAASNASADDNLSWFAKNVSEPLKIRCDPQARAAPRKLAHSSFPTPYYQPSPIANHHRSESRRQRRRWNSHRYAGFRWFFFDWRATPARQLSSDNRNRSDDYCRHFPCRVGVSRVHPEHPHTMPCDFGGYNCVQRYRSTARVVAAEPSSCLFQVPSWF